MKTILNNISKKPIVSIILLDWSVRESFHVLYYLRKQKLSREKFEIIIIEFYSRVSEKIKYYEDFVDQWIVLEMPDDLCYHKHLMYNVGILRSRGEIIVLCDSDAMVKDTFLDSILFEFNYDPNIVLHFDQFRNVRQDLYPFNYPPFNEVVGEGCINSYNDVTTGIALSKDPLHDRNYGACFSAKRIDLISIGGADEHPDYIGHICGPYEMTFRLINSKLREVWHPSEFLYHTWHPGQDGENDHMGPHDGHHISTTALEALISSRTMPLVENPSIKWLRNNDNGNNVDLMELAINKEAFEFYQFKNLTKNILLEYKKKNNCLIEIYKCFLIRSWNELYRATPLLSNSVNPSNKLSSCALVEIHDHINSQFTVTQRILLLIVISSMIAIESVEIVVKKVNDLVAKNDKYVSLHYKTINLKQKYNRYYDIILYRLNRLSRLCYGFQYIEQVLINKKRNRVFLADNNMARNAISILNTLSCTNHKCVRVDDKNQLYGISGVLDRNTNLDTFITMELFYKYHSFFIEQSRDKEFFII